MPLILVVEQEEGVVTHLRRTLEQQGEWRLHHARTVQEAMQRMASEAPELFVVSTAVTGAGNLLGPFARRQGGPGTLALIPEHQAPSPERLAEAGLGADAALAKPVTGEQVLDAARSILKAGEKAAPAGAPDEPKLTSHDIFGDLVEEVEREQRQGARPAPRSTPGPGRSAPTRRRRADDDIERRLEQTLSGVLSGGPKRKPRGKEPEAGDAASTERGPQPGRKPGQTPVRESGSVAPGPPRRKRRAGDVSDVDDLLSKTLSGLDLPRRKKPTKPKSPPSPPDRTPGQAPDRAADQSRDQPRERAPDRAPPRQPPSAPAAREPSPPEVSSPEASSADGARPSAAPAEPPSEPSSEPEAPDKAETAGPSEPARPEPVPPPQPSQGPPEPSVSEPPRDEIPTEGVGAGFEQALADGHGEETGGRAPDVAADEGAEAGETTPPPVPFEPRFADTLEEVPDAVGEVSAAREAPAGGGEVPQSPPPEPEPPAPDRPDSPPPAAPGEARAGTDFGQYRLLERIGLGGMAEVWKARMTGVEGFQKTVAIKKILAHLTDSADFVDMFIDEAKLAAQLNHANIIHIYDLGKIDGDYYIAMEYVEGENLRAILNAARAEGRPLPVGLALFIAAKLASALDYAHHKRDFEDRSLELVHRDVSPQNVLVGYEGTIKLCDFGIVKAVSKSSHTRMGALKGKLQYMSPEQAWGRTVDARSDIFSVGSLLFEMLTGRRLFRGDSEMEVLEAVRECRVQAPGELDPSVPEEVDAVVLKALAADPDDRYQKAGEMARRLEEILVSMRPSPGQGELAAYMRELFERLDDLPPAPAPPGGAAGVSFPAEGEPAEPPSWAPPGEEAPGAPELPEVGPAEFSEPSAPVLPQTGTAPAPTPRDEPPDVAEPPREVEEPRAEVSRAASPSPSEAPEAEDADATGSAVPSAASTVEAVEPVGDVEPEEGGKTGRTLLVLAILAALVAAAVLYWFVWRPRSTGESSPDAPPAPQASEDPAASRETLPAGDGPDSEQRPATGGDADGPGKPGASAGGEAGSAAASADGAAGTDGEPDQAPDRDLEARVEQTLEEKLAREEEELRRQYEEKQRELAERLAEAERRAETSSSPAPETGGRGAAESDEVSESAPTERAAPEPESPPGQEAMRQPAAESTPESTPDGGSRTGGSGSESAEPARATGVAPDRTGSSEAAPSAGGEGAAPARDAPTGRGSDGSESESATETGDSSGRRAAGAASSEPEPEPDEPEPEPEPEPSVRVGDLVQPGPGVTPPQLVTFEKPEYPPVARRLRVEGTVVVSVLVDENGDVADTRLKQRVRQRVGINEAALEAARRAKYRPATKDGVRVKMWTTLRIPFRL